MLVSFRTVVRLCGVLSLCLAAQMGAALLAMQPSTDAPQPNAPTELADGSSGPDSPSPPLQLEPLWATQVDPRWRLGQNVGTEDDGITVEFVEFSADGKRLVTANGVGKAFVLHVADGSVEKTFTYITDEEFKAIPEFDISGGAKKGMEVECGAFSPDGQYLVLGGNLNGVKVFDLHSGELVQHFHDEQIEVDGLGVSPDGRFLGYAAPHACQVRSLSDWSPLTRVQHGDVGVVNSVDFSRDGSLVASAGNYGHVLINRTSDWKLVGDGLIPETSSIKSVRLSPDKQYAAAGHGKGNKMVVWRVADMSVVKTYPLHYIEAVAWTEDGRYLLAGGRDDQGRLRIYETRDWKLVADPIVQADRSNIEYIDIQGDLIAIAGEDAHVRLYRLSYRPPVSTIKPVNPNATAETTAVLQWMAQLPSRVDKRVISGQHFGRDAASYRRFIEVLHATTGKWVALAGADVGYTKTNREAFPGYDIDELTDVLIDYWQSGGLITLSYHAPHPWTGSHSWDNAPRDLRELMTAGHTAHDAYMKDLDRVATALAKLRDAGVVVIWRPFHECNGKWFWWGHREGRNTGKDLIDLWRHQYRYFTDEKRLNNLLWAYSPSSNAHEKVSVMFYYPGDEFVDIVGVDFYGNEVVLGGYEELTRLDKPFGLTEFGPHRDAQGTMDYEAFINTIRENFPKTTFFLPWHTGWSIIENKNGDAMMDDPWIIDREEIDW